MAADADPWCDWCQREFCPDGPEWKVETGVVTGLFCSKDCADRWSNSDDTPERVTEPPVATDGGQDTIEVNQAVIDEYLEQFAADHHEATVKQRKFILRDFVEWCRSEGGL